MTEKRHAPARIMEVLDVLTEALTQEKVSFAFLLGTAAEGLPFRDLDVAVFVDPAADLLRDPVRLILDMAAGLEGRVHRAMRGHQVGASGPLPAIDVHLLNGAPLGFCYEASRGRLLMCRDPDCLEDWRESTWSRYLSMEPYYRDHARQLLGGC